MKTHICLIIIAVLGCKAAFAQDYLYLRNGKTFEVKILEVKPHLIHYRLFAYPQGTIYEERSHRIEKIIFEDGKEQFFSEEKIKKNGKAVKTLPPLAYNQAIKVPVFALLSNHLKINYERQLKPNRSLEFQVGIVGLGNPVQRAGYFNESTYEFEPGKFDTYRTSRSGTREKGFLLSTGLKFSKNKNDNPLRGFYLKPTVSYSYFTASYAYSDYRNSDYPGVSNYDYEEKIDYHAHQLGLLVISGYQQVFAQRLVLDLYFGGGIGLNFNQLDFTSSGTEPEWGIDRWNQYYYRQGLSNLQDYNMYSHMNLGGFAALAGISLGFLLK